MTFVNVIQKGNYSIVQLNRPKVNAINQQMVNEIRQAFANLQADDSCQGVILTGVPRYFSAGLDLIQLYDYNEEQMNDFFISFASLHIELARFPKPFICAINGHAPAGGTVLAIAADYRIMVDGEKYSIGLNEVAVNIQISQMLITAYSFWIGRAKANRYILDGKLLPTKEAHAVGLVDAITTEEELLPKAEKKMRQYLAADPNIWKNTKAKLRKEWLESIDDNNPDELKEAMAIWWDPTIRARMKMFVDMLTTKK